jgi:hypothetical protein
MGTLFVDNIKQQSSQGSGTITIGASGETVALGSGVTPSGNFGNLALLHTTEVSSSVSSVDIDGFFSSTYDKYFMAISNLSISTDTKYLIIKVNVGGSTQTSTIYTQVVGGNRILTDGTSQAVDGGSYNSYNYIFGNWNNSLNVGTDGDGYNAELFINDPLQTSKHKQLYINSIYYGHGSSLDRFVTERNANLIRTTSALSGINFSCTGSATIDKGTISLYGLRK